MQGVSPVALVPCPALAAAVAAVLGKLAIFSAAACAGSAVGQDRAAPPPAPPPPGCQEHRGRGQGRTGAGGQGSDCERGTCCESWPVRL